MATLDLGTDLLSLTRALCDIPSVSGDERAIADAVEGALRAYAHLEVLRDGDAVVARTHTGRPSRVVIAGHLDTVPIADNLPTRLVGEGALAELWGRGTVDMKAGVAVQLALAAELTEPTHDVTWVFYDHEEVAADLNGLGRLVRNHPDWVAGDFAVLCEPTNGGLEGGCNGTLRVEVRLAGVAAHSARAWMGRNAIHAAGEVLRRLEAYEPAEVEVDGLVYRESLNAVLISGRHGGERHPRRVRRHGELPVRALGVRRAGHGARARAVRRLRRRAHRRRTGRASRPGRPGGAGLRAGRARRDGRRARGRSTAGRTSPGSPSWGCPP